MPFIVFLSDFGLDDPYVAQVKGAIFCINPVIKIVDLTHAITPQNIMEAAFILGESYRYFPEKTIFLSVVDPGVGSDRKCMIMDTGEYLFVAPDNGILTVPFMRHENTKCHLLENNKFFKQQISATFHGRDIMGPTAAWLGHGHLPEEFGPLIENPVLMEMPEPRSDGKQIIGHALFSDRFGNIITNINADLLHGHNIKKGDIVHAAGKNFPIVSTYSDVQPCMPLALTGSLYYLELAVNQGSAAKMLGLTKQSVYGTEVVIMHSTYSDFLRHH